MANSLTEDGHTIVVRSVDWRLITPCITEYATRETWSNELFRVTSASGKRVPLDELPVESDLAEASARIVTDPSNLSQMMGMVSVDTKEQLADLGYR